MYNHAPKNYICPICLGVEGKENEDTLLKQDDLVYKDDNISAFINSFWVGKNSGHVIVVPNNHFENIYDLPNEIAEKLIIVAKKIALALKVTYKCEGITLRQNNEPASEQHAFHFHLHVFPRFDDDNFNSALTKKSRLSKPTERIKFAEKIKSYLN